MNKRKLGLLIIFLALAAIKRRALFLFFMEFLSSGGLWGICAIIYIVWLFSGGKKALLLITCYVTLSLLLWFSNVFYLPHGMNTDFNDADEIKLIKSLIVLAEENYTSAFDVQRITEDAPKVADIKSGRVIAFAYPKILNRFNLSGIFIPLNGRCYINRDEKSFLLPFVAVHELSHRKGILNEGQANIEAFIHCMKSDQKEFRYSAVVYALKYAMTDLKNKNEAEAIRLESVISDQVFRDLNQMSVSHENTRFPTQNYCDLIPGLIYYQSITSQGVI